MLQQQSAGFILFRLENNTILYLLLQHTNGGHWDFPKGRLETGETKEQAALRELKEETGINGCIIPHFEEKIEYTFINLNGNKTHKSVFFFIASTDILYPTLSHEHTDYAWLSYEQALKQLTYTTACDTLAKAHAFLKDHYPTVK
ncbi:MAG: NUDIX domain-containing protein [Candidatus Dependentiae bacterium]|jgi:8-oxo-dGTP pyrophosphatase MutT (NUDIX family)|nr:NUDIX domain-containing protein [Candidatus Dependentiae bacterium]